MDRKTLLMLAVLGFAGYYLYRRAADVVKVFRTAGEALGSGLFDLFHPDPVGERLYYNVLFPDGQRHSVPSRAVANDATFVNRNLSPNYPGDGRKYKIIVDKTKARGVNKTAYPV